MIKYAALLLVLWVAYIIALNNHGVTRAMDALSGIPTVVRGGTGT